MHSPKVRHFATVLGETDQRVEVFPQLGEQKYRCKGLISLWFFVMFPCSPKLQKHTCMSDPLNIFYMFWSRWSLGEQE